MSRQQNTDQNTLQTFICVSVFTCNCYHQLFLPEADEDSELEE